MVYIISIQCFLLNMCAYLCYYINVLLEHEYLMVSVGLSWVY